MRFEFHGRNGMMIPTLVIRGMVGNAEIALSLPIARGAIEIAV
jgi:hypothetical protein